MSMSGQQRLELERARLEALRLEQVRQECMALADGCEAVLRDVRDIAVQQFAATELRKIVPALQNLRRQVRDAPDSSRTALLAVTKDLHDAIARAEGEARRWTASQAQAVAEARHAHTVATANACTAAIDLGLQAIESAESGDVDGASKLASATRARSETEVAAKFDERVRKEVVRGLLKTLKEMGFVTVGPQLDAGVVTLEGRLASGRRARFDVSLDGTLAFDLDGYEGRACADDLEKVEITLRDRFGVKLGPPQIVWKNPDRISKGAQDLPTGSTRRK